MIKRKNCLLKFYKSLNWKENEHKMISNSNNVLIVVSLHHIFMKTQENAILNAKMELLKIILYFMIV